MLPILTLSSNNLPDLTGPLYLDRLKDPDDLPTRADAGMVPRIVQVVFTLSSKALRELPAHPDVLLATLEMTSRLMERNTAAICTIEGTLWLDTLIHGLTKVSDTQMGLLIVIRPRLSLSSKPFC